MNYFSTIMTEIDRIPAEVCKDLHENIGNNCWQKQDCGFTMEHAEISSISNIPTREKEVNFQEVIVMVQPHESASTSVPCKLAHPRLSSSGPVCRICHEDDSSENLISPCECTGTLGLVHRNCLEKWLSASNTTECEICKYQFNTYCYQRSIWQWFQSHRELDCHQGLYGDVLCLLILTPPCLVSIYLCGMGSAMYMKHGLWEAMGLAMLCSFLLATFLLWVAVTVRFHWKMLRRWQRMNQMVRLTDLQQCHHASRRQQRTEVNNNGHPEQGNTSGSSQVFEMNAFV